MVQQNPQLHKEPDPRTETQDNLDRMEARQVRSASSGSFLLIAIGLIAAIFIGGYVIMNNSGTNDAAVSQPSSQTTVEITPAAPAAPSTDPAPEAPAPQSDSAPATPAPKTDAAPAGTANQ